MSVASEWVEDRLEIHGHAGSEYLVDCPFCGRPKMYVNPDRGFICFRCREKGRIEKLVIQVDGGSLEDARRRLTERAPTDPDEIRRGLRELALGTREGAEEPIVQPLPDEFIPCFNGKRWRVPGYLDDRELDDDAIIRHGLGYCEEGRYRDRVIVPIAFGPHRTFLGRLMGKPSWFRWTDKRTGKLVTPPKYMSPKGANLSHMLYGCSWVKPGADLVGVEGTFDVMRLTGLGFQTVGFFGKRITVRQAAAIRALKPRSLTVLFDDDAAAYAFLDALRLVGTIPEVKVGKLPEGHDPDSLGLELGARGVREVLRSARPAGNPLDALSAALEKLG